MAIPFVKQKINGIVVNDVLILIYFHLLWGCCFWVNYIKWIKIYNLKVYGR
jgi:hypothetical protein